LQKSYEYKVEQQYVSRDMSFKVVFFNFTALLRTGEENTCY